jgi:hypothetical protein
MEIKIGNLQLNHIVQRKVINLRTRNNQHKKRKYLKKKIKMNLKYRFKPLK